MAKLDVLKWPDQGLRATATRVTEFDAQLHQLVDDMFETMYTCVASALRAHRSVY